MVQLSDFSIAANGLDHAEDVARGPDGWIYAGGEAGQLYRVDIDTGDVEQIATTGGFVLGLVLDGSGSAYVCDIARHAVLRIELDSGSVTTYSSGTPEAPISMPNGLAFAADGTLYFCDSGEWQRNDGCIYAVSPEGNTTVFSRAAGAFPNGMKLDPNGQNLYIAESSLSGVSRLAIAPDGTAGVYEVLARMPGVFPDGIALATDGTVLIGCYSPDRIYGLSADGNLEVIVDDPIRMTLNSPTNVAFAGPDSDVLVVANLGRQHLSKASLGITGVEPHYPRMKSHVTPGRRAG